jgi:hypothetical protein
MMRLFHFMAGLLFLACFFKQQADLQQLSSVNPFLGATAGYLVDSYELYLTLIFGAAALGCASGQLKSAWLLLILACSPAALFVYRSRSHDLLYNSHTMYLNKHLLALMSVWAFFAFITRESTGKAMQHNDNRTVYVTAVSKVATREEEAQSPGAINIKRRTKHRSPRRVRGLVQVVGTL